MRNQLSLFQRKWTRMALAVGIGFCTMGANVALMATAGYLIAKAATHPATILLLWVPIVSVRFFGISRAVFRYAERLVSHDVTLRVLSDLRTRLYNMLEQRWPAAISNWSSGELLNTMTNDIDVLQNIFLRVLTPPVVALMTAVLSCTIIALCGGVSLTGAFLVGLIMVGVVLPVAGHISSRRLQESLTADRANLYQKICDLILGMQDLIMADDGGRNFIHSLETQQVKLDITQRRLSSRQALMEGVTVFLISGTAWVMLATAIPHVKAGLLDGVMLSVVILTALSSFEAVLPLPNAFAALGESTSALGSLRNIENWPIAAGEDRLPPGQLRASSRQPSQWHVRMEQVSFAYCLEERNVLTNISLDVYPGKHLAIVGHNGAGKSTLIHLLTRLWDVTEGVITIDGIDVRDMPCEMVRSGFAVVSPTAYVFNASVMDNLRIAKPTASLSELKQAIQAAQLQAWIDELPDGFDTVIGEMGHALSGGQRQRLAIARAILSDAPIWLLDEPFESLDAKTASQIQETLQQRSRHRAMIWITHQLNMLGSMDEIIVLHHGVVVERGSHADLLRQKGQYRQMWDQQMDMFR